ncbi:hypothetical protein MLD38_015452 [Melastoma candidum]|uniref:Uncharacterized protein n=1 Tax=Melastoma candidum TaxID=119954 RepID=A0ACB9RI24_9MYRT|nr:hypothetical protein MLD38_015452 [Melastoma candidum]
MQGGRGGQHPFFESDFPFPEFGRPFPGFGGLGGLGGRRSFFPSFFGGNPFDDPFFTNPFGGLMESSFFGSGGNPFMGMHPPPAMIENRSQAPERRGLVIEELNSDEEEEDKESGTDKKENPRKHGRSSGEPDVEARRSKYLHHKDEFRSGASERRIQPQGQSFTFHSSTVSYGGVNGTYYTSSKTRRSGSDGVVFEECKEADSSTMQATHQISRGLHNQGHSVTRKLGSDGKVDTVQTLHNLDEDQLPRFEQNWNGSAGKHLPGWSEHMMNSHGPHGNGWSGSSGNGGIYALPSTQQSAGRRVDGGDSRRGGVHARGKRQVQG